MDVLAAFNDPYVTLGVLLLIKHFWADGPLQFDYMAFNKGKFMHWGGISHALTHGACTAAALWVWTLLGNDLSLYALIWLSVFDTLVHYTIDFVTRSIPDMFGWVVPHKDSETGKIHTRVRNKAFYRLVVADQCAHFLTYLVIISLALNPQF